MADSQRLRDFGSVRVPFGEHRRRVGGVFSSVARRYDLMNDAMSLGQHRAWKDAFVALGDPRGGAAVLDMAGGTGDIARRLAKLLARRGGGSVTLCDASAEMVRAGKPARHTGVGYHRLVGLAEAPPCPRNTFDLYTISFGIRNVTDRAKALEAAFDVLKPGGRFACLEFSRPALDPLRGVYRRYSDLVIPRLGRIFAGDAASYRYLVESIRAFPDQHAFAAEIDSAGFEHVQVRDVAAGIAAIHWARKPI
jgi:demethylmenaquinone methyltransferase/2-methoxy-6-polyprenyl-1,4-benzoquinol methylase